MKNDSDKTNVYNEGLTETLIKPKYEGDLKELVTDLLKNQGPLTRGEMVDITGIPRTTLFDTLDKLILSGKVDKYKMKLAKKGRPTVYYEIRK
jgi:predicted ArsR family transcriptional regulator